MEKNEKKKWYVQPETEVVELKSQIELLGSSESEDLDCDIFECTGCDDDF